MNFLEFVSDQYVSLNIDHCFNGFFFNKVPLFKKLKLREVVACKLLYGSVTSKNDPKNNPSLYRFPTQEDGTPITYTLESEPYIEASAGISNIANFLRIDVVKRFSYLNHENVSSIGLRMKIKLDF